jgi:hypothetical protein
MCLDSILNEVAPESGFGYKIFIESEESYKKLEGPFYGIIGLDFYDIGSWYIAEQRLATSDYGDMEYTTGFHIFESLEDCESYRLRFCGPRVFIYKVEFSGGRVVGIDSGCRTIIADKMKILEKVEHD